MSDLADVLRKAGREFYGIEDGEYFDSGIFDAQAKAVKAHILSLIEDAEGDADFIIWSLNR